jgi:hypothetical protein
LTLLPAMTVVRTAAGAEPARVVRAGVGVVDATWHVGASAGQYATDRFGIEDVPTSPGDIPDYDPHPVEGVQGDFDTNVQSVKRAPSYGVDTRLSVRAIVVEGTDGTRVALLKSDNYLAQDALLRRVGQLLAGGHSGVRYDHILYHATHDHSSPSYTTPAWGVWIFQDVMDLRMLEYQARAMASAIERAASHLVPVRMGATTVPFSGVFRNAPGGAVADDGSPTGYPHEYNDTGLVVMRFDDISTPTNPQPLATWMNYGVHPEDLDGYDLISGDYVARLERMVQRDTGAPLVFSQGDVGSSEPTGDSNQRLPNGVVKAFSHQGYAQAEREARLMADAVKAGWQEIGAGGGTVPYSTRFPVAIADRWTPLPVSHPYPSVSNCRTEPTLNGDIGLPILGLPDCERPGALPVAPPPIYDALKSAGVPIPENYDAPSFTGVEENLRIHLQAVRLGEVLLASCSCEPQVDLIKNLESRTDDVAGNIYDGFAWEDFCSRAGAAWKCADPRKQDLNDRSLTVTDAAYKRMVAEVHNDAKGWDDPANVATANAEPADPAAIKGNFTKEELPASLGYKLPVGIGHGGDYNGYTVSYRMYMSFDHYRKALTCCGAHTADYMATRLVRMAGTLKGGPALEPEPLDALGQADEVREQAAALALGRAAATEYAAWLKAIPNESTSAYAVAQPTNIQRFDAATFSWVGGNPFVDNPLVRVERLDDRGWATYADQGGEVQTRVDLPKAVTSVVKQYTKGHAYTWTANFEAPDFFPRDIDPRSPNIPDGTYRFVVNGLRKHAGRVLPYKLTSEPFKVSRWTGLRVASVQLAGDGSVVVTPAPVTYPRTYPSSFKFVHDDGGNPICKTCSFRPWAATGEVASVAVHIVRAHGVEQTVAATRAADGSWHTTARLRPGDEARVEAGGLVDTYGEVNGAPSATVTR